jgi:hypothetical protein
MVSRIKGKTIRGKLQWAQHHFDNPRWLPSPKGKGARSQLIRSGITYETQFVRYIAAKYGEEFVEHGPWFSYADDFGKGWCQPDFLVYSDGSRPLVIGECKRTAKVAAIEKLEKLYAPVVLKWINSLADNYIDLSQGVKLLQVCKYIGRDFDEPTVGELDEVFDLDTPDTVTICFPKIPKV